MFFYKTVQRLLFLLITGMLLAGNVLAQESNDRSATSVLHKNYPQERKWVSSQQFPWRAIGRINLAGYGHCTATLVAEDVVLTAAHCLWNQRVGRWYPAKYLTFVAGVEKESFQGIAKGVSMQIAPGYTFSKHNEMNKVKRDWALLKLNRPLGKELGYLPLLDGNGMFQGKLLVQAGYRGDRAFVLTVQTGCTVKALHESKRLLQSNCRTTGGDSGGPVLSEEKDGWYLVGLHSGRLDTDESLAVTVENFRPQIVPWKW
ncbi:trypsin-like serine protease [Aliamphritea spongicola]|uniref:trypsin-like serine protease n=1 Tax=Aliamphritea spongicola TaxID=707589 RepID=UPI00196A5DD7|nr:trypsin-like serine protease [Aliamphritea spongicola]